MLIIFLVIIGMMTTNNNSQPSYSDNYSIAPENYESGPFETSYKSTIQPTIHLDPVGYGDDPPPSCAPGECEEIEKEEDEDVDDEDVDDEEEDEEETEEVVVSNIIDSIENEGEFDEHVKPYDPHRDTTNRIKTGGRNTIKGFRTLFDIHTPKQCCSKKSVPNPKHSCTTKNTKNVHKPYSSNTNNVILQHSKCATNHVDPAGLLCYSSTPEAVPIHLSPSSCLPPSISPSACKDPSKLVYTPEAVDPIKYNVRKHILNPPQNNPQYIQPKVNVPPIYPDGAIAIPDKYSRRHYKEQKPTPYGVYFD